MDNQKLSNDLFWKIIDQSLKTRQISGVIVQTLHIQSILTELSSTAYCLDFQNIIEHKALRVRRTKYIVAALSYLYWRLRGELLSDEEGLDTSLNLSLIGKDRWIAALANPDTLAGQDMDYYGDVGVPYIAGAAWANVKGINADWGKPATDRFEAFESALMRRETELIDDRVGVGSLLLEYEQMHAKDDGWYSTDDIVALCPAIGKIPLCDAAQHWLDKLIDKNGPNGPLIKIEE